MTVMKKVMMVVMMIIIIIITIIMMMIIMIMMMTIMMIAVRRALNSCWSTGQTRPSHPATAAGVTPASTPAHTPASSYNQQHARSRPPIAARQAAFCNHTRWKLNQARQSPAPRAPPVAFQPQQPRPAATPNTREQSAKGQAPVEQPWPQPQPAKYAIYPRVLLPENVDMSPSGVSAVSQTAAASTRGARGVHAAGAEPGTRLPEGLQRTEWRAPGAVGCCTPWRGCWWLRWCGVRLHPR